MRRLGDDRHAVLQAPPQQDLRRGAAGALGDRAHPLVAQVPPGAERAVSLGHSAVATAGLDEAAPVFHGAELDLIDGRNDAACGDYLVKVVYAEVRDADRLREPALLC